MTYKYIRTSLARTRMARIPWIARKQIVIAHILINNTKYDNSDYKLKTKYFTLHHGPIIY